MCITVIAVDPSIRSLGLVILQKKNQNTFKPLLMTTLIEPKNEHKLSDEIRLTHCADRVQQVLLTFDEIHDTTNGTWYGIIERPQSWGAYKSVASTKSGSLLILHLAVGVLFRELDALKQILPIRETFLTPVSTWKGQLPKHVTALRMKRKYGVDFRSDDESDALGLADWFLTEGLKKYHINEE